MTAPSRVLTASRTLTAVKGKALYHDGIDDYVSIPDDPSLDITDAITIEAWVSNVTSSGISQVAGRPHSESYKDDYALIVKNVVCLSSEFKPPRGSINLSRFIQVFRNRRKSSQRK